MPNKLVQKLAKIMGEINNVPKNGFNAFHKYHYVQESDLVEAVRDKLAQQGIFIFSSVESCDKQGTLTTVQVKYTFIDGESGESFEVQCYGQGDDKGDKGVYKAITGAMKYMIMKQFLVSTNDDPEADEATDTRHYNELETKKQSRTPTIHEDSPARTKRYQAIYAMGKEKGIKRDEDVKLLASAFVKREISSLKELSDDELANFHKELGQADPSRLQEAVLKLRKKGAA